VVGPVETFIGTCGGQKLQQFFNGVLCYHTRGYCSTTSNVSCLMFQKRTLLVLIIYAYSGVCVLVGECLFNALKLRRNCIPVRFSYVIP
jgi:hypothetical protein